VLSVTDFERNLIRERTGEGRKRAMAHGVKFGRKPTLSPYQCEEALKARREDSRKIGHGGRSSERTPIIHFG